MSERVEFAQVLRAFERGDHRMATRLLGELDSAQLASADARKLETLRHELGRDRFGVMMGAVTGLTIALIWVMLLA